MLIEGARSRKCNGLWSCCALMLSLVVTGPGVARRGTRGYLSLRSRQTTRPKVCTR
jgi:hypothetical protein